MPVANPGLGVEALAPMTMVLLCREDDDRWPADGEIAPEMLADVPLILLRRRSGTGIYERIVEAFSIAGISCSVVVDCTDLSAIYTLVERNVGLGLLPIHGMHVPRRGFSTYPVALATAPERLALVYPRGRRVLPAVQRAMDLCRTSLRTR